MDDTLKRLLAAEQRAQQLVDDALQQQEQMLEQARLEAHQAEQHFDQNMQELRRNLDAKAEDEAQRNIAEMERRFDERRQQLEALADQYGSDAREAAIDILTDPDRL